MSQSKNESPQQEPTFFELWKFNVGCMAQSIMYGADFDFLLTKFSVAMAFMIASISLIIPAILITFSPFGFISLAMAGVALLLMLSILVISIRSTLEDWDSLVEAKQAADAEFEKNIEVQTKPNEGWSIFSSCFGGLSTEAEYHELNSKL